MAATDTDTRASVAALTLTTTGSKPAYIPGDAGVYVLTLGNAGRRVRAPTPAIPAGAGNALDYTLPVRFGHARRPIRFRTPPTSRR